MKYAILILLALIVMSPSVLASENCPSPGQEFGQHISTMTPDHAKMHGDMFGKMVSCMARGLECQCPMNAH